MRRPYNFSAGPAAIADEVLAQAAAEMLDWHDANGRSSGMGVMEMSHRGREFMSIYEGAEAGLRNCWPCRIIFGFCSCRVVAWPRTPSCR